MPDQLETLRTQALAIAETLEHVVPELRTMGLGAAIGRKLPAGVPARELIAGMRQAIHDLLTSVGQLSGTQLRIFSSDLHARHGIELDSLQHRRLRRIATIRERGHITSEEQWYLVRSRIDEISGLDRYKDECEALQQLANTYEFRHSKA